MQTKRVAVLASGEGTLLQAMIDSDLEISLVVSDRICGAVLRARAQNIPTKVVAESDRTKLTQQILKIVLRFKIDIVASAGFARILGPEFFQSNQFIVLNSHPSLKYRGPGHAVVKMALENNDKYTGMKIHKMTEEVDAGEVLVEARVKIEPNDTVETLWERIKVQERLRYPVYLHSIVSDAA